MSFITRKHKGMESPHTSFPIIQYSWDEVVSFFPRLKDWYIGNQFWEKQPVKKPRTINANLQNPKQKWI
jgi:hypothetical protein